MNNSATSTLIATRAPSVVERESIVRRWIAPGLGAGAAFLLFEMLVGAVTTTAWAFPQSIVETIGLVAPTSALAPSVLLLGVTIHMAFSVGLGAVFITLTRRLGLRGTGGLLVAGVLFMWAESAISIWGVLHTLFPSTLYILFSAVPFWASIVGRTAFGMVLASLVAVHHGAHHGTSRLRSNRLHTRSRLSVRTDSQAALELLVDMGRDLHH
jgi:hypothetical protein